jgi:hypothetical protein
LLVLDPFVDAVATPTAVVTVVGRLFVSIFEVKEEAESIGNNGSFGKVDKGAL